MVIRSRVWFFIGLVCLAAIALLLGGCTLETVLPVCDPAAISLVPDYPNYRTIPDDLSPPTFEWGYYLEEGGELGCSPDFQHIRFGFRTFDESGATILTVLDEADLRGDSRSWTTSVELEPASHYFWEMTWSGAEAEPVNSRRVAFNTGPVCTGMSCCPPSSCRCRTEQRSRKTSSYPGSSRAASSPNPCRSISAPAPPLPEPARRPFFTPTPSTAGMAGKPAGNITGGSLPR